MSTQSQKITKHILNMIASGEVGPGDRLDETHLANQFGVSRSPVRDAMMKLEVFGLITRSSRSGAVIFKPDFNDYSRIHEVHATLETQAAGLAARRISNEGGRALQQALAACDTFAGDAKAVEQPLGYSALNVAFHTCIFDNARNEWLKELLLVGGYKIYHYLRNQYRLPGYVERSNEEHRAICMAILENNPAKAEGLMRSHVELDPAQLADLMSLEAHSSRLAAPEDHDRDAVTVNPLLG